MTELSKEELQRMKERWNIMKGPTDAMRLIAAYEAQVKELERLKEEKASCERVMFKLEQEKQEARNQLREAVEILKCLVPNVVYKAIRHYDKQSLYAEDEWNDLNVARNTHGDIKAFLSHIQGKDNQNDT